MYVCMYIGFWLPMFLTWHGVRSHNEREDVAYSAVQATVLDGRTKKKKPFLLSQQESYFSVVAALTFLTKAINRTIKSSTPSPSLALIHMSLE
jgi:hypothetical protein